jgi:hypothetical protein
LKKQTQTTARRVAGARTAPADRLIGNSGLSLNSAAYLIAFVERTMVEIKASLPVKIGRREVRTMREFRELLKAAKHRQLTAMHKADAAYRKRKATR